MITSLPRTAYLETMDALLETIDLDVEESSELLFKVKVEGIEPSPAKVRLVCEAGDLAYMFNGHPTSDDGVVQFLLPILKDKIREGLYQSRVEVLIENRYFAPVQFNINFKKAVKVVAEAVQVPQRRVVPQVSVTASPIVVKRSEPVAANIVESSPKPIVVETPVKPQVQKVVEKPVELTTKLSPSAAKLKASTTLKERYSHKLDTRREEVVEIDETSEDLIRELAQTFVRTKKR